MGITLTQLRVARAVRQLGTVTAAARAAFMTQPAATQALAGLERQLGAALFERSPAGLKPSPTGEVVVPRLERALHLIEQGVREALGAGAGAARGEVLRRVTVSQLQTLIGVAEHSRFSAAARAARRSRPTVHRAARELEDRLGMSLFETTSHGQQPTREAVRLAQWAQRAFAELAQASAEVLALRIGDAGAGATRIGAMPLARSILIPEAVLTFSARFPTHRLTVLDGPYEGLLHELRIGSAAFLVGALRGRASGADVVEEPLFDDPLSLIVRPGHPLVRRRRIQASDLLDYPWIAPREGSPLRKRFLELFEASGLPVPESVIECNSQVVSRGLLASSDRIMLLSELQMQQEVRTGQLVAIPHPHGRVVRAIGLTTSRDWHPTAAQAALVFAVRQSARRCAMSLMKVRRTAIP